MGEKQDAKQYADDEDEGGVGTTLVEIGGEEEVFKGHKSVIVSEYFITLTAYEEVLFSISLGKGGYRESRDSVGLYRQRY